MAIENDESQKDDNKEETATTEDNENTDDSTDEDEDDQSEDEEESDSEHSDNERDLDAEIEEEEKRAGKPADGEESAGEEDDDQPLTRGEFKKLTQAQQKEVVETTAVQIATTLANGNAKLARLAIAKWKNRGFPQGMSLNEQVQEAFTIAAHKHLIGTTEEVKRALKNRRRVRNDNPSSHRDSPNSPSTPELSKSDKIALERDGYKLNPKTRRFEKQIKGGVLVRDNQTKKVSLQKGGE